MDKFIPFLSKDVIDTIKGFIDWGFFYLLLSPIFWVVIIICILVAAIKFKKLTYISVVTAIAISMMTTFVIKYVYNQYKSHDNSDYVVGITALCITKEGKIVNSDIGLKDSRKLISVLNARVSKNIDQFSKFAAPRFVDLSFKEYEINNITIANLESFLDNNYMNSRYRFLVIGIYNKNGALEKVKVSVCKRVPESYNNNSTTAKLLNILSGIITSVAIKSSSDNRVSAIDDFLYPYLSQSIAKSIYQSTNDPSLAIRVLENSESQIKAVFEKYHKYLAGKDVDLQMLLTASDINKYIITKMANRQDESLSYAVAALKRNIYFPCRTYKEFKSSYDKNYTASAIENELALVSDDKERYKKLKNRLDLYSHGDELFLDEFQDALLTSDDFEKNVHLYEKLARVYPDNALVYLYWADALKYYKSEAFNLNLNHIEDSIKYYIKANKCDPSWKLIGLKTHITATLWYVKAKKMNKTKDLAKIEKIIKSTAKDSDAYGGGKEFLKYTEK